MPIILVQNEKTAAGDFDHYEDITGKTYQFPNQYKNIIVPGELFIYYRGLRMGNGRRRKAVEYFGYGVIDKVFKNEKLSGEAKKSWIWDCTLCDYQEFDKPVRAKLEGKGTFEDISNNRWGVVRNISKTVYLRIVSNGSKSLEGFRNIEKSKLSFIDKKSNFLKPFNYDNDNEEVTYSKRAKLIGDLGENYVFNYLKYKNAKKLKWVANQNIKPGWDIEYMDKNNLMKYVEVKSTTKKYFSSIHVTKNEWKAAMKKGNDYQLWLITEVETCDPKVTIIEDFETAASTVFVMEPLIYRVRGKF